jgi:hypothetical protein
MDSPQTFKIEFVYDMKTKRLTINGNIMDPLITYGIIEMAKSRILPEFYNNLAKQAEEAMKANGNDGKV